MKSKRKLSLSVLESQLLPPDLWQVLIPKRVQERMSMFEASGSVGVGYNIDIGWFILMTQGQGPVVVWADRVRTYLNSIP